MPLGGVAVLGYTLYKNTFGLEFPYDRFPIVVLLWLLIAVSVAVLSPTMPPGGAGDDARPLPGRGA